MAKFQFSVTPPRQGSQTGRLSPRSWLHSSDLLPSFQSCGLPFTAHDQAQLVLDPQHRDVDRTISDYHERISGMLPEDRVKISVLLPAEPKLLKLSEERQSTRKALNEHSAAISQLQAGLTQTQTNLTQTQTTLAQTQTTLAQTQGNLGQTQKDLGQTQKDLKGTFATLAKTQTDLGATQIKLSELRTDHELTHTIMQELLDRAKREDRVRFAAFKANLMTGFVKKLSMKQKVNIPNEPKGKNDPLHDSTKYMNAATTLFDKYSAREFKERTGLDPAYRVFLGNYRKYIEARREWAHETDDEFARLLLTRQFQEEPFKTKENVEQWEKLLLWVSGKDTLEEMAQSVEKA